jgi:hypothetical protein
MTKGSIGLFTSSSPLSSLRTQESELVEHAELVVTHHVQHAVLQMDQADDLGAQPRVVSHVERRLPLADGDAEGGHILHPIDRRLPIGFLLRSSNRSANALPIRTIEKPPPKMMRDWNHRTTAQGARRHNPGRCCKKTSGSGQQKRSKRLAAPMVNRALTSPYLW